jgi:hypothetical protein
MKLQNLKLRPWRIVRTTIFQQEAFKADAKILRKAVQEHANERDAYDA